MGDVTHTHTGLAILSAACKSNPNIPLGNLSYLSIVELCSQPKFVYISVPDNEVDMLPWPGVGIDHNEEVHMLPWPGVGRH